MAFFLGGRVAAAQSLTEFFNAQPGNHSDGGFRVAPDLRTDTIRTAADAGTVMRYFPTGQLQEQLPYRSFRKQELHGTQTRWFASGQVQAREEYVDNRRHGELLTYYPSGTVRRREHYQHGQRLTGECFAPDGQPLAYVDYMLMPEYPGGLNALLQTIGSTTKYPKLALKQEQTGQVQIAFIIDKKGQVSNAHVLRSVAPLLDAEALRVVNSLRGWKPGRLDGEAVDVYFTLPVTFTIQ
ncbi:protein TonB [Hymenobacter mucosus]|uniref:Protein TonB n=1 Tax=Hymenobacter mucosus TaxID=1411120 RepID=A0A238V4S1_9BACT|nr:protein TonB [Hymenobacter mucosus]